MAMPVRLKTVQFMKDVQWRYHSHQITPLLNLRGTFPNIAKFQMNNVINIRPFSALLTSEVKLPKSNYKCPPSGVTSHILNSDDLIPEHCARYSGLPLRYQSKREKEREETRDEDTLIYTYEDQRRYKSIVACGFVITFVLFGEGFLVIYDSQPDKMGSKPSEDAPAIEHFKAFGKRNKFYFLGTAYLLIGAAMCYLMPMYVGRSVTELRLLKGGEKLQITTYSVLGPKKQVVVPLAETDFKTPRHVKGSNISFGVKGKRLLYMIDKKNGQFHDSNLFDLDICMKRHY